MDLSSTELMSFVKVLREKVKSLIGFTNIIVTYFYLLSVTVNSLVLFVTQLSVHRNSLYTKPPFKIHSKELSSNKCLINTQPKYVN